ncbi:MFS monocarboxylate transporter [Colletotrichum plurivorum]|uniref:MFS monocarboxylate transporter n=1 Tax=Colletotrichum plurivorum TaxID=2175906 RepID=A0A8H6KKH3_9PEZI|nr:MFS monocarboxylate transporter [Colletotrichum plurivorum]
MNGLLKPRLVPRKTGPLVEWAAFREPTYVLFCCGCFFYFWALYFGFFYINSFARYVIGFSSTSSNNLLLITNAVGIPARPVFGWIADTFVGPVNMFLVLVLCVTTRGLINDLTRRTGKRACAVTLCVGGLLYAWIGIRDRAGMYAFSAVYGIAASASQGMFVSSLASLTKDPSKMGIRFGMVCTILAFATLAGPPTAGAIIDRAGGRYVFAQIWGGAVMLLCFLMVAAARVWGTGLKLLVWC